MARSEPPDIIFLDIRLPKLDGFDVLEALRADPKTQAVPVVILTSHSEKELVERGARLGALDHLIKSKTTPAKQPAASTAGSSTNPAGSDPPPNSGHTPPGPSLLFGFPPPSQRRLPPSNLT